MLHFPPTLEVSPGVVAHLHRRRLLLICRMKPGTDGPPKRTEPLKVIRRRLVQAGLRQIEPTVAVNHSNAYLWIEDTMERDIDGPRFDALVASMGATLDEAAPVYMSGPNVVPKVQASFLPHVLLIEPQPGAPADKLVRVIRSCGGLVDKQRSQYLGPFLYVALVPRGEHTAFSLRARLLDEYASLVRRVCFEQMPLMSPLAYVPDDRHYGRQWNVTQIHASRAWDVTRGAGVTVAIFDSGCQHDHPDLEFTGSGFNADTMAADGSPVLTALGAPVAHGTNVAGVVGARINNAEGIAGIAGDAAMIAIAGASYSDVSVAVGIGYAVARGARVINMSFATEYLSFWGGMIPAAIDAAVDAGCVLCASAGNGDSRGLLPPALHPRVMAVGGSDRAGERWRLSMGGVVVRGSNYGDEVAGGTLTGVSVVAPADLLTTTALTGVPIGSPFDGYDLNFNMTSAATPHVAAVAALVCARFPGITPAMVRRVIEQSAEKVGSHPYAYVDGFYNGTRNEYLGYGRVHAFHALRVGDVFIRDWPGDSGDEPSTPPGGNFFSRSDIVIRPVDDESFRPDAPETGVLEAGRDHVIAVRATNRGPAVAHEVRVDVRVTPFVGLEFHYPDDWVAEDALHIRPEALTTPAVLEAGTDGIATFALRAADAETAGGWADMRWHPCVLAVVTSPADFGFEPARVDARSVITRFNNLAQRNLSVLRTTSESIERLPFAIGHPRNEDEMADLIVEADPRLTGSLRLWLAGSGAMPPGGIQFDRQPAPPPKALQVAGGRAGQQGQQQWVDLTAPLGRVTIARAPRQRQWLGLEIRIPRGVAPGERLTIHLRQARGGVVLGGATVIYVVA